MEQYELTEQDLQKVTCGNNNNNAATNAAIGISSAAAVTTVGAGLLASKKMSKLQTQITDANQEIQTLHECLNASHGDLEASLKGVRADVTYLNKAMLKSKKLIV